MSQEEVTAGNVLQVTTEMKNILERADDVSALHLEMIRNLTGALFLGIARDLILSGFGGNC